MQIKSLDFSERTQFRLLLAGVVLAAVLVYANSLTNGFAYDDDWIIMRNPRVHQLADLSLIWGTPYWPTFGAELGLYRPLAIFAYALEWAAGGGAPWVFHVVNVTLHAIVTGLVFVLLASLFVPSAAAVGALIFAVHPVHTEVVANSVGQAELIAAVFVIGACVIYVRRPRTSAAISWPRIVSITAFYFVALLAKEAAITLPALLILLDLVQRRIAFTKNGFLEYASRIWMLLFVMGSAAVMYLSIRVDVLGSVSGLDAAPGLPFLREEHRVLNGLRAWPEYVRLLVFPKDLSNNYAPAVILPVESLTPMAALGGVLLIATIGLALLTPKHPEAAFPAAWFFITILTVSNLLFPIGVLVAERTLYTPSVAVAAAAAFAWQRLRLNGTVNHRRLSYALLILVVGLMSYRSVKRNPEWKNTLAILNAMVRDYPESYHTAWLLAEHYWRKGDVDQSAFYWEAAIRLWPRDSQLLGEVANFHIGRQNWTRAIQLLERSRSMHPWVPRTYEMLAFAYVNAGRYDDALKAAQEAIKLDGTRVVMFAVMARVYEEKGRMAEAAGAWRSATHLKGGSLWVYRAMQSRALARNGNAAAAIASADSALKANAQDTIAAWTLSQLKDAIQKGCYKPDAPADCNDPVAGWRLTGHGPPPPASALLSTGATPRE